MKDAKYKLYERFILEYYRIHHKNIKANSEKLDWNIDQEKHTHGIEFLPTIDLNQPFEKIRDQLDSYIEYLF